MSRLVATVAASKSRPSTSVAATPAAASATSTAASTAGSTSGPACGRIRPTRSSQGPAAKPGSISRMPSSTAATSAPSGPTVSRDGASGYTPCTGTRPQVVLRPTTPQQAAGIRTEPPVSVPSATSASPVATATAEPLDDPPGRRRGSSGFTGVPDQVFVPTADQHSSVRFALPTMAAPERRAAATTAASRAAGLARSAITGQPTVVGTPSTSMQSFTASRTPQSPGPAGSNRTIQVDVPALSAMWSLLPTGPKVLES